MPDQQYTTDDGVVLLPLRPTASNQIGTHMGALLEIGPEINPGPGGTVYTNPRTGQQTAVPPGATVSVNSAGQTVVTPAPVTVAAPVNTKLLLMGGAALLAIVLLSR